MRSFEREQQDGTSSRCGRFAPQVCIISKHIPACSSGTSRRRSNAGKIPFRKSILQCPLRWVGDAQVKQKIQCKPQLWCRLKSRTVLRLFEMSKILDFYASNKTLLVLRMIQEPDRDRDKYLWDWAANALEIEGVRNARRYFPKNYRESACPFTEERFRSQLHNFHSKLLDRF